MENAMIGVVLIAIAVAIYVWLLFSTAKWDGRRAADMDARFDPARRGIPVGSINHRPDCSDPQRCSGECRK